MSRRADGLFTGGPLVTVYIPARNYGRYLRQAIDSVRQQLYPNWELFIIDEASEDETAAIADQARREDPERIRVITHDQPQGLQRVANRVLGLARGAYIMRLDADDWLEESALLLMTAKLESDPGLGLVYGNYFYTDPNGVVLGMERRYKLGVEDMAGHVAPHGACTMVRTRALKAVGGYSEDLDAQDGWDLWHKLVHRVKAASLEAPVFYYRQHDQSMSRDNGRLLNARSRIMSQARGRLDGSYRPSCFAVVPVKESYPGFEGVPYVELRGRSLLEWALASAQTAHSVTHVAVSSESERVLGFSEALCGRGVVQPHMRILRPTEMARPRIRLREILLHAGEAYCAEHGAYPDIVVFLSLHAPLRQAVHIDKAVDTLRIHTCDSVVSVCEEVEPVFTHGRDGLELLNPGRFDGLAYERERLYHFNGAVLSVWWEILAGGDLFGQRIGYMEMGKQESVQLKGPMDVESLRQYLGSAGSVEDATVEGDVAPETRLRTDLAGLG
jgi:glycosyltransferase involved in cell wall biosynthesis